MARLESEAKGAKLRNIHRIEKEAIEVVMLDGIRGRWVPTRMPASRTGHGEPAIPSTAYPFGVVLQFLEYRVRGAKRFKFPFHNPQYRNLYPQPRTEIPGCRGMIWLDIFRKS